MKKTRNCIIWLTVLALMFALAGCGPAPDPDPTTDPTTEPTTEPTTDPTTEPTTVPTEPPMTVETLLAQIGPAMEANTITQYAMGFGFDMSIEMESEGLEIAMDIGMNIAMDTVVAADGTASYANTLTTMNLLGSEITDTTQVFALVEDGTVVTYTYSDTVGQWTFADTGLTLDESTAIGTNNDWLLEIAPEDLTLDEETQTLNGAEVYVLRTDTLTEFSESMAASMGDMEGLDLSEIPVPTVVYIDIQTSLPVQVDIDMQPLLDAMSEQMAASLVGEVTEDTAITMTATPVSATFSYDEVTLPELPQEARDQAQAEPTGTVTDTDTADLGNGSFVLDCGTENLLITCPEGWSGEVYADNNIWIYNGDGSLYGDYYYLEGWTEDDLMTHWFQPDVELMQDEETFVSQGDGPVCDGYVTKVLIGTELNYYYAWMSMGDGYFIAYIYDFSGVDNSAELLPQMLALVTPYTATETE